MKKFYALSLIYLSFFCVAISLNAQEWTKLNLPETGKNVTSMMEANDGTLYASTEQGLFSSTDDAQTWELVNRGLKTLALDVTQDGKPLCLNTSEILSVDENNALEQFYDLGFFFVQFTPNLMTAADGSLHLLYGESLQMKYFISTDGGSTFVQQTYSEPPLFEGFQKSPFFKNPINGDLYYLADNYTLQRSTDNGGTYNTVGTELDVFSLNGSPFAVDEVTGHLYYVSSVNNDAVIQKSIDHGETWSVVSPGNTFGESIAAYDGELVIWGGNDIFYSPDDGANWNNVSSIFGVQNIPEDFFVSANGKFFGMRTEASSTISDGITEVDFQAGTATRRTVGLDYTTGRGLSSNGNRISASLSNWAHYTDDFGQTWTPLRGQGAHSSRTYTANDGTVYTEWLNGTITSGLFMQNEQDSMVEVLDSNSEPIFQLRYMFEDDSDNMYLVSFEQLYKSSNGGAFTPIAGAPIDGVNHRGIWFSSELQRIFSITGTGDAYYSDDEGETWTQNQSIGGIGQSSFPGENQVWAFNLSTSFDEQGYYTSTDLQTWTQQSSTINNLAGTAYGLDANTIMAYTEIDVQLSSNAGLTWEVIVEGIELAESIGWFGPEEIVNTLELQKASGLMLLSANGGIYYQPYAGGPMSIQETALENVISVYPNPVVQGEFIHVEGGASSYEVHDLAGRMVLRVSNENVISTSSLQKGMYLVKSTSTSANELTKFIVE